jgi:hypothetical protein
MLLFDFVLKMWNLSVMMDVVHAQFGGILPLSEFVPRVVLSAILGGIGILALLESVYLRAQATEFGSRRIGVWLTVFRAVSLVLFVCSAAVSMI